MPVVLLIPLLIALLMIPLMKVTSLNVLHVYLNYDWLRGCERGNEQSQWGFGVFDSIVITWKTQICQKWLGVGQCNTREALKWTISEIMDLKYIRQYQEPFR